jgi:SMI1 / KNR4 family (SUKH-1)
LKRKLKSFGKRSRYVGGKSEACICAAEKKLGVRFPPGYRQFLADFGAGKFKDIEIFGVLEPADKKKDCARQYLAGRINDGEDYKPEPGDSFEYLDTVEMTLRQRKAGLGLAPELIVLLTNGYGNLTCLVADPGHELYGIVVGADRQDLPKRHRGVRGRGYVPVRALSEKPYKFTEYVLHFF